SYPYISRPASRRRTTSSGMPDINAGFLSAMSATIPRKPRHTRSAAAVRRQAARADPLAVELHCHDRIVRRGVPESIDARATCARFDGIESDDSGGGLHAAALRIACGRVGAERSPQSSRLCGGNRCRTAAGLLRPGNEATPGGAGPTFEADSAGTGCEGDLTGTTAGVPCRRGLERRRGAVRHGGGGSEGGPSQPGGTSPLGGVEYLRRR